MSELPDLEVLHKAATGDKAAWNELIARHYNRAVRWAKALVGWTDAEDVAQEAFRRACITPHLPLDGRVKFTTFLFVVVRNAAIDLLNYRRRQRIDPAGNTERATSPHEDRLHELRHALCEAIDALPEDLKEVVLQSFFDEVTFEKIGQSHGYSQAKAWNQVKAALAQLRHALKDWESDTV